MTLPMCVGKVASDSLVFSPVWVGRVASDAGLVLFGPRCGGRVASE